MAKKKKDLIPIIIVPPNATLRQMVAALKRDFSAADLQKFTEIEPGISGEKLMAQLETIHKVESR